MPKEKVGPTAAAVDGKIYAMGGVLDLRGTYAYDPATNTWTQKADMPTGRWVLSSSVVNGKIYAIGGRLTEDGPAVRAVEEYDPATDTWTRKADLPQARFSHAAAVVDGKIYVIAGSPQPYVETATVYAYDPAANTWARKADAPTARGMLSASALYGRIYVIGGVFSMGGAFSLAGAGSSPYRPSVEEYDPATDTWTIRADLPTPRGNLSTIAVNDRIYAIGGMKTWSNSLATVEEYDPYPLVVDFNGDGMVETTDLLALIESWGRADLETDIGPRPFGDGVTDAADLEVLMDHWGQQVSDNTLRAHWKLDESEGTVAGDSAGNNDGTVLGLPAWQPSGGAVGGALEFDGATSIVANCLPTAEEGPFSVLAWIQGGAPGQVVISRRDGANWLMVDLAQGTLKTELAKGSRSAGLASQAAITDGNWHRIAFTWDGANRRLYVDGVLAAEDIHERLADRDGSVVIGAGKDGAPGSFWSGLIDDVRIYNRAVAP